MNMTFDDRKKAMSNLNHSEEKKHAGDITRSNCIVCRCADPSNRMPTETKAADWRIVEESTLMKNVTICNTPTFKK